MDCADADAAAAADDNAADNYAATPRPMPNTNCLTSHPSHTSDPITQTKAGHCEKPARIGPNPNPDDNIDNDNKADRLPPPAPTRLPPHTLTTIKPSSHSSKTRTLRLYCHAAPTPLHAAGVQMALPIASGANETAFPSTDGTASDCPTHPRQYFSCPSSLKPYTCTTNYPHNPLDTARSVHDGADDNQHHPQQQLTLATQGPPSAPHPALDQ